MAKVPKVKKRARRGASPSAPANKAQPVESEYNPWMHAAQNAGISKKKKTKQLTRQQKARHVKGVERGDVIANKLEKKVADSKARAKKVQARAADWDQLNGEAAIPPQQTAENTTTKAETSKAVNTVARTQATPDLATQVGAQTKATIVNSSLPAGLAATKLNTAEEEFEVA